MSHQTGIRANEELKRSFAKCREGKTRLLKISIENEELVLSAEREAKGTWDADFDTMVSALAEPDQPCYMLYRLDSMTDSGYEWLFVSWSPDSSPVRQKMLYASTKATLKQEFGSAHIKEELHGSVPEDVTLRGYGRSTGERREPAPLTEREQELQQMQRSQACTDYGVDSKRQTLGGVALPVTETCRQALVDMAHGLHGYLQLRIDLDEERIHLADSAGPGLDAAGLAARVPEDRARYHLYNFRHTHEGDPQQSLLFIYSMPGCGCSVRERMLYSSCKAPLLEAVAALGLAVDKRLEVECGADLTHDALLAELHPQDVLHRPKFAKPKGPPNRGAKRMTRTQAAAEPTPAR